MKSLWPDLNLNKEDRESPAKVLTEQSEILNKMTNGMLRGKLMERRYSPTSDDIKMLPFAFNFRIESDFLNNYSFELLSLYHDIEIYPVYIDLDKLVLEELVKNKVFEGKSKEFFRITIHDQNSFIDFLETVFGTIRVQNVLRSIIDLATDFKKINAAKSSDFPL